MPSYTYIQQKWKTFCHSVEGWSLVFTFNLPSVSTPLCQHGPLIIHSILFYSIFMSMVSMTQNKSYYSFDLTKRWWGGKIFLLAAPRVKIKIPFSDDLLRQPPQHRRQQTCNRRSFIAAYGYCANDTWRRTICFGTAKMKGICGGMGAAATIDPPEQIAACSYCANGICKPPMKLRQSEVLYWQCCGGWKVCNRSLSR